MFKDVYLFELRYRFKMISTYVYWGIFFIVGLMVVLANGGAFPGTEGSSIAGGGIGKVLANAPFVIYTIISFCTYFGLLLIAAISGNAGYRDFERNTYPLVFSSPISKGSFIFGRYFGAVTVLAFIFSATGIGLKVGSILPFVKLEKIGNFDVWTYLQPYVISALPNIVIFSAIFFSVALLARKIMPIYISAAGIFMSYLVAGSLFMDIKQRYFASLVDIFGLSTLGFIMEYWTVAEKNSLLVSFTGPLVWNRVLWLSVAAVFMIIAYRLFSFTTTVINEAKKNKTQAAGVVGAVFSGNRLQPSGVQFNQWSSIQQLAVMTISNMTSIIKNRYFLIINLLGIAFLISSSNNIGRYIDTTVYPMTYTVIEMLSSFFLLFIIIIIAFYSGELVWRERDRKIEQINDALPTADWMPFVSKIVSLMGALVLMQVVLMVTGIGIQAYRGYYNFEIGLYCKELFGLRLINYFLYAMVGLFLHTIVNNKYVGHVCVIGTYFLTLALTTLKLEHPLYRFSYAPSYKYSDINGFGHFLLPFLTYKAYWICFVLMLAIAAMMFWVRGKSLSLKERFHLARQRFTAPYRFATIIFFAGFIAFGSVIFYNTNILNTFRTKFNAIEARTQYEKLYSKYRNAPQPKITDVSMNVDIFPQERALKVSGVFVIKNKTKSEINELYINLPSHKIDYVIELGKEAERTLYDKENGFMIYRFHEPLKAEELMTVKFSFYHEPKGFLDTEVVYNGTFFQGSSIVPSIGYSESSEIRNVDERKKHGLPPKERKASVDDMNARMRMDYISDADWINYEAVVSTGADQTAFSPGELIKTWKENGRNYYHYKSAYKILNFYSFLSGKYELLEDKWNDVVIQIYYHKGHNYNIQRMVEAVKDSLEYNTKNVSPYMHKTVRIIEFPRYADFAQSFPTMIPYSEEMGFIAKLDKNDIDYVYNVTAHEVSHFWWGHQLVGANVQGSDLLCEVFAQYSSLQISEKKYGAEKAQKFLAYEMDSYFRFRGYESRKELPLKLLEGQGYIHYKKGNVIMAALTDYIGEERLNTILAKFVQDKAYQEAPYTTSVEFLQYLRDGIPDEYKYLITDMFDTITLYENKTESATYTKRDDGMYDVALTVISNKLRAGDLGEETPIPVNDFIDIGVKNKAGKMIYIKKHKITSLKSVITVTVAEEPAFAGIDPYVKLMDRKKEDNSVKVTKL